MAARSRVNKFELMEPSLEEIFIDVVGADNTQTRNKNVRVMGSNNA